MIDSDLVRAGQDEGLDRHLTFIGITDCKCDFGYRSLGRWMGVNMGKGWVRVTTHPDCRHHGTKAQQEWSRRTKGQR